MKYHIMSNGKELAVMHECDPQINSNEWEKVGQPFEDYKRASQHADALGKAWRQVKDAIEENEQDEDDQQPNAWNKLLKGGLIFASGMSIALSVSALVEKDVEMALGGVQTGLMLIILAQLNGGME